MSDLQRRLQNKGLPSGLPPRPVGLGGCGRGKGGGGAGRRNYSPLPWSSYWETRQFVTTSQGRFCVYTSGREGAVTVVCLHGGGYSALTWSVLARELVRLVDCRVVAIDLRGHGETKAQDESDLSGERMAGDVREVVAGLQETVGGVVLVGHSMGGALAVLAGDIPGLVGLVVIDVVEGTALEALASMQGVLQSRPSKFSSVEQAVEWAVRSGQVRNVESARVSMPGQVVDSEGFLASSLVREEGENQGDKGDQGPPAKRQPSVSRDSIKEEDEEESETEKVTASIAEVASLPPPPLPSPGGFRWRIDLAATERHWPGWFTGLSERFLSAAPSAKLLLLAGVDRLDRDLTVGQMQGKFQMQVLPQVGHTVHEDSPERVAEVLATFLTRHKLASPTQNFTPSLPAC